jgi:hypothetical protein
MGYFACEQPCHGHIIRNIHGSLETTLLYITYGIVWAPLVSLAKDYLDNLDDMEKEMNV